ncbi:MAG: hypothetical protein KDC34_06665 [Saprospiraceae bacterium]|nr:hypothetical protein [Saprospiraceae bacterium]
MYQFLTKYGQLLAFGLGILVTVIFLIGVIGGLDEFNSLSEADRGTSNIFNFGLVASMVLTVICCLAWFFFAILHIADNPKGSLKGLLGVLALVAVFVVLYFMAKPATGSVAKTMADFNVSETTGKFISASISTTFVLLIGASLAFLVSEVRNFFK